MKHRRSIDLTAKNAPAKFYEHKHEQGGGTHPTLMGLMGWEVLGVQCGSCLRTVWLDHAAIVKEYGDQYLHSVGDRMRCKCGNKTGNKIMIGTLGR